jgi:uncharacterized membrane protein
MDHGMRDQMMGGGGPGGGRGGWDGGYGGMEHGLSSGFGWWFGIALTLMTISLIVLAVYAVMAWHRGRGAAGDSGGGPDADAKAVLDQRLATGEIGPDDYTRRLNVLRGPDQPTQPG